MYYAYVSAASLWPNITFHEIMGITIVGFAALRTTNVIIPYIRNGEDVAFMTPSSSFSSSGSESYTIKLIYK